MINNFLRPALLLLVLLGACAGPQRIRPVGSVPQLGIIADCQFADQDTRGVRHYRSSPGKLKACIRTFNALPLSHIFHLGDFIDLGGMPSIEVVMPILREARAPHTLVLGNHDFSVPDELKLQIPDIYGLPARYFSLKMGSWKFIVLDGNDVSLYAWPQDSPEHLRAAQIYRELYDGQPKYNGALGAEQMEWLESELDQAERRQERVILLCHFPLLPTDNHVLWNAPEVVDLISRYSCVRAWLNGHNHAGAYTRHQGIHFVTFKGMVDTEDNAFATIQLQDEQLIIRGYGREPDRILSLKRASGEQ